METPNAPLRLVVLGPLDLRGPEGHVIRSILVQPKRFALLAYLGLASPGGFQRRDKLLALFWPELDSSRARNALSQALHVLRRGLGEGVVATRGDEEVGLSTAVWCDGVEFEKAVAESRWSDALDLYRGDLLEGFFADEVAAEFDEWVNVERARLKRLAVHAALSLSSAAMGDGNLPLAIHWAQRASLLAPYDEEVLIRRLTLLSRQDRAQAVLAYEEYRHRLLAELELEPSAELDGFVQGLRSQSVAQSPASIPTREAVPVYADTGEKRVTPGERRSWGVGWRTLAGIATAGVVTLALLAFALNRSGRQGGDGIGAGGADASSSLESIAVLPFEDRSQNGDHAYLSVGITEEIIIALDEIEGLRVTGIESVMQFKDSTISAVDIAAALGVAAIMTGSVQVQDGRVRIRTQLLDARADTLLWTRSYEKTMEDVLSLQSEIASTIALALRNEISPDEELRLERRASVDFVAFDYLLKGRSLYNAYKPDSNEVAIEFFRRAVERDSTYVDALIGLADAYRMKGQPYGAGAEWEDSGLVVARRAVRIDPNSARAYEALGWALNFRERDREALDAYLHAVRLDPDLTGGLADIYYNGFGRLDEALINFKRALVANQSDAMLLDLTARTYSKLGMYEEADSLFRRVIRGQPGYAWAYSYYAVNLIERGRFDEARAVIPRLLQGVGETPIALARAAGIAASLGDLAEARSYYERSVAAGGGGANIRMAWVYQQLGEPDRAQEIISRHAANPDWKLPERKPESLADLARRHLLEGNRDEALRQLEAAVRKGWRDYYITSSDPILNAVRTDPGFDRLMAQAKDDADRQRTRVQRERL